VRVLLAGATGVIGRQTVPVLAAAGHQVIGLARTPARLPDAEVLDLLGLIDVRFSPVSARTFALGLLLLAAGAVPAAGPIWRSDVPLRRPR
jgi:nucleoside-diphosphate-sugar epimerase